MIRNMRFALLVGLLIPSTTMAAHAADTGLFSAPTGTILNYHVVTTTRRAGSADTRIEYDIVTSVVESDEADSATVTVPRTDVKNAPSSTFTRYRFFVPVAFQTFKTVSGGPVMGLFSSEDCDQADIQNFLPLGRVPSVTVSCTRKASIDGIMQPEEKVSILFEYEGKSNAITHAGKFEFQNIREITSIGDIRTEMLRRIDTKKGVLVSSDLKTVSLFNGNSVTIDTETQLIAITP